MSHRVIMVSYDPARQQCTLTSTVERQHKSAIAPSLCSVVKCMMNLVSLWPSPGLELSCNQVTHQASLAVLSGVIESYNKYSHLLHELTISRSLRPQPKSSLLLVRVHQTYLTDRDASSHSPFWLLSKWQNTTYSQP